MSPSHNPSCWCFYVIQLVKIGENGNENIGRNIYLLYYFTKRIAVLNYNFSTNHTDLPGLANRTHK